MSNSEMQQAIEALKAENEALKARVNKPIGKLTLKVSEKGAVSVYGLGRFPVTLYREAWLALVGIVPEIKSFIDAHKAELDKAAEGKDARKAANVAARAAAAAAPAAA